jgi:hypothetical protein
MLIALVSAASRLLVYSSKLMVCDGVGYGDGMGGDDFGDDYGDF